MIRLGAATADASEGVRGDSFVKSSSVMPCSPSEIDPVREWAAAPPQHYQMPHFYFRHASVTGNHSAMN